MTFRALCTGIIFTFFVSAFVYFNGHAITQTYLIRDHFPIIVSGAHFSMSMDHPYGML